MIAGNQAIAYTMFVDGQANRVLGIRGLLWADAGMNAVGVLLLVLLTRIFIENKKDLPEPLNSTPDHAPSGSEPERVEPT